jgi:hypothetical protein
MAIFKEFAASDIKTARSFLNQLVDIINQDISGSSTRKKYQVFVTGGVGPGVTSSLFQTVFDQDFTLQTANPVFDITLGLSSGSSLVQNSNFTVDSNGKYIFPSQSLMMREKMDLYRLHAQSLLGGVDEEFTITSGSTTSTIREALFLDFKRLFARDQIKRETFAIKLNPSGALTGSYNLNRVGSATTKIYSDIGSSDNKEFSFGGQVSTIVDSSNTDIPVGLLFIDKGIAVLDISRSLDQVTFLSGTISGMSVSGQTGFSGSLAQFLVSASVDDILDHVCSTRFSGSAATACTFQNITNINSTIYFCNLAADEFNYSSNPTFTDTDSRIVVIDQGQEETQRSFTFVTSIGLYDANDNLLAAAKTSRPILKDDERNLTLKIRLDF